MSVLWRAADNSDLDKVDMNLDLGVDRISLRIHYLVVPEGGRQDTKRPGISSPTVHMHGA